MRPGTGKSGRWGDKGVPGANSPALGRKGIKPGGSLVPALAGTDKSGQRGEKGTGRKLTGPWARRNHAHFATPLLKPWFDTAKGAKSHKLLLHRDREMAKVWTRACKG